MPLQPTPSQEKFFSLMHEHGKEGFVARYESDRRHSLYFLFLRKEEARRKFFSLFFGREHEENSVPEGNPLDPIGDGVSRFAYDVEKYGLDDFKVIRGIQELVLRAGTAFDNEHIEAIQALSNVKMGGIDFIPDEAKPSDTDEDDDFTGTFNFVAHDREGKWEFKDYSHELVQHTVQLLKDLKDKLANIGSVLEEHGMMESSSQVLLQIDLCINVLKNIDVVRNGRTYNCSIPKDVAMPFDQEDRGLAIEEQTIHPYIHSCFSRFHHHQEVDEATLQDPTICSGFARGLYVQHLGLDNYLQYYQMLAVLLQYAAQCKAEDGPRYGSVPTLLSETDGLTLRVQHLVHPQWAEGRSFVPAHEKRTPDWRGITTMLEMMLHGEDNFDLESDVEPEAGKEKSTDQQAKENLWLHLEQEGCLQRVANTKRRPGREEFLVWTPGLSRNHLVSMLEQYGAPDNLCKEIYAYYGKYGFNPFQEVSLNCRERILILTGANSNGKSTLMRSIALALNTGMTGRKIQAVDSYMSFCDGIYHDFEVHDDVKEGVSTFRAQIRNVLSFLNDATPHSLGLFDEMYHGTSSLYLLALAWATVESMSQRELRAVISTHEPMLTFSTQKNGLELLRGRYANQRKIPDGEMNSGIDGVANISLRNHFELRGGAVMDSDALKVAEEEKMPTKILKRAEHIKSILMGQDSMS